jgi:hypothetical protein
VGDFVEVRIERAQRLLLLREPIDRPLNRFAMDAQAGMVSSHTWAAQPSPDSTHPFSFATTDIAGDDRRAVAAGEVVIARIEQR